MLIATLFLLSTSIVTHALGKAHSPRHIDPGKRQTQSPPSSTGSPSPSPSPSLSSSSSTANSKSALALAQNMLALSSPSCNAPGSGCTMLNLTLSSCSDDACGCSDEITLGAQVCAQCSGSQNVVNQYNSFLSSCQTEGLVSPDDTVLVTMGGSTRMVASTGSSASPSSSPSSPSPSSPSPSSPISLSISPAGSGVLTAAQADAIAGTAVLNSIASGNSATSPTAVDTEDAAADVVATSTQGTNGQAASSSPSPQADSQSEPGAASVVQADSTYGTSSASDPSDAQADSVNGKSSATIPSDVQADSVGGTSSVSNPLASQAGSAIGTSPATDTSTAEVADSSGSAGTAGTDASSGTAEVATGSTLPTTNTSALNAAIAFFGAATIDPSCTSKCSAWQSLSSSCTDDTCICNNDALASASGCLSCIGSATHAANYSMQMTSYAAFTGNCTTEVAGLSPSGAATSGSPDDVGTPTSALSPAAGSTSGVTATAAGAEEAVVTKTSNASPFAKLPSSVNHCTAFIATVIGALLL